MHDYCKRLEKQLNNYYENYNSNNENTKTSNSLTIENYLRSK